MNSGNVTSGTGGAAGEHGRVRLYELAKDLGVPNKELVEKFRQLGIDVKNHMSNVDAEDAARVKRALDKERQANLVEERLSSTVIRRRSKDGQVLRPATPAEKPAPAARPAPPPPEAHVAEERRPEMRPAAPERRVIIEQPPRTAMPTVQEKRSSEPKPAPIETQRPAPPPVQQPSETTMQAEAPKVKETPSAEAPAPAPGTQPAIPAAAGAATPAEPKKDEPTRRGPTGRVIELPLPRIQFT